MTPQDQEFLHDPANGTQGDCIRAVIASLLDLPIAQVPHFAQDERVEVFGFYTQLDEFLEQHGYDMAWNASPIYHLKKGMAIYHCISGPSPRDETVHHAVVGRNCHVFFDPHPSRLGLGGDPQHWRHSFLCRLVPQKSR